MDLVPNSTIENLASATHAAELWHRVACSCGTKTSRHAKLCARKQFEVRLGALLPKTIKLASVKDIERGIRNGTGRSETASVRSETASAASDPEPDTTAPERAPAPDPAPEPDEASTRSAAAAAPAPAPTSEDDDDDPGAELEKLRALARVLLAHKESQAEREALLETRIMELAEQNDALRQLPAEEGNESPPEAPPTSRRESKPGPRLPRVSVETSEEEEPPRPRPRRSRETKPGPAEGGDGWVSETVKRQIVAALTTTGIGLLAKFALTTTPALLGQPQPTPPASSVLPPGSGLRLD